MPRLAARRSCVRPSRVVGRRQDGMDGTERGCGSGSWVSSASWGGRGGAGSSPLAAATPCRSEAFGEECRCRASLGLPTPSTSCPLSGACERGTIRAAVSGLRARIGPHARR